MMEKNPKKAGRKPHDTELSRIRKAAELTQEEVAQRLGWKTRYYRRIESGEVKSPGPEKVLQLAWAMTKGDTNPIVRALLPEEIKTAYSVDKEHV